jgi:hypothetical protein
MNNDIQQHGRKESTISKTSNRQSTEFELSVAANSPSSRTDRMTGSSPAELHSEFVGQLAKMLNREQGRLEQARVEADRLSKTRRGNLVAFDLD